MKNSIVPLIVFLFASRLMFGSADTILIKPGKGVDNIVLLCSSRSAVKKYKRSTFISSKGTGIACGIDGSRRFRNAEYKNDSLGITFIFKTRFVRAPLQVFYALKLREITFSKTGQTVNGLVIGKSTKNDVEALYGILPNWKNPGFIAYSEKGISMNFDEQGVITGIQIFEPYKEQNTF